MLKHVQFYGELHLLGQISGKDIDKYDLFYFLFTFSVIFIPGDAAKQFKDHTLDPHATTSPVPPE
jgi:hypothetical protein